MLRSHFPDQIAYKHLITPTPGILINLPSFKVSSSMFLCNFSFFFHCCEKTFYSNQLSMHRLHITILHNCLSLREIRAGKQSRNVYQNKKQKAKKKPTKKRTPFIGSITDFCSPVLYRKTQLCRDGTS